MLPSLLSQVLDIPSDDDGSSYISEGEGSSYVPEQQDEDDDMYETMDEDEDYIEPHRRTNSSNREPSIINLETARIGQELLQSGEFGAHSFIPGTLALPFTHSLPHQLLARELAGSYAPCTTHIHASHVKSTRSIQPPTQTKLGQHYIPNQRLGHTMAQFDSRAYSGQFSQDGKFFYTCCQDFTIHLFETQDPHKFSEYKVIPAHIGRWTITDASLSADNRFVAYSSITPIVHVASTLHDNEAHFALDFSQGRYDGFGIWSLRFSGDGRELIAGTSSHCIYVYDVEANRVVVSQSGHEDDVNAVCYADTQSSHVFYSGSDDTFVKVWDRRAMRNGRGKSAGVLVGHTEGITYVASKGDGRYCLSNGKDQTMKLWDIRMLMSEAEVGALSRVDYRESWDYRYMRYPGSKTKKHPHDRSVCTYNDHSVKKTLIRCHFSPMHTTGQRYVFSGSDDGHIHIYGLDGTKVETLNASSAVQPGRMDVNDDPFDMLNWQRTNGIAVVRDASWHPDLPFITATTWNGRSEMEGAVVGFKWTEPVHSAHSVNEVEERAPWNEHI